MNPAVGNTAFVEVLFREGQFQSGCPGVHNVRSTPIPTCSQWAREVRKASRRHHPNDFHQDAFVALTVKFGVVNLFPRTEMQASVPNGHRDLLAQQLPFEVGITVVFSGPVVVVFFTVSSVAAVKGSQLFEPRHDVVVKAVFQIVDITRGGDVHWVDEHQAVMNAAFSHNPFDVSGDANDFVPFVGVDVQFFNIGRGGSSHKVPMHTGIVYGQRTIGRNQAFISSTEHVPPCAPSRSSSLWRCFALPMASAETASQARPPTATTCP